MSTRSFRKSARRIFGIASLAIMGIGAGALTGCPGTLEDPARFDVDAGDADTDPDANTDIDSALPTCADIPTTLFHPVCGTSGCHSAVAPTSGLDLESPDVFARIGGKMAAGGPGTLLDPGGDPGKSVLYAKLTDAPPFGSQMPLVGDKLSSDQLACVASWITAQAAANRSDAGAEVDAGSTGSTGSSDSQDAAGDSKTDG